jgi:hypothetical protein
MVDLANITVNIRVDAQTNKGSVIDVIRLVNPDLTSGNASVSYTRLASHVPDIASSCVHIRMNGKGRLTPCADVRTLVEVVFELPGKAARDFRRKAATQICRQLAGDLNMVAELEARHMWWQQSKSHQQMQHALLRPPSVVPCSDVSGEEDGDCVLRECTVRDELALREGGTVEVCTAVGRADVVTAKDVIEVKAYRNWKSALGQVLAYSAFMPDKQCRIHLFAPTAELQAACAMAQMADSVCKQHGVTVTLEVLNA